MKLKSIIISLGLALSVSVVADTEQRLDLNNSADAYKAMLRIVGDLNGKPVFKDWDATIFMALPGEKPTPILRTIGFNVGKMIAKADGSYEWVTREVSYYVDLKTGKIIESWQNPLTQQTNCVVQVANDPVSNVFPAPPKEGPNPYAFFTNFDVMGDVTALRWDIPLKYPNALKPAEFPKESTGENYVASEHFFFFAETEDLTDPDDTSTDVHYAWTRTGPWLPWMELGTTPGYLIYSGHGRKYHSFDELSEQLKSYTLANFPEYNNAPDSFYQPNETSWTYYAKMKRAGKLNKCNAN